MSTTQLIDRFLDPVTACLTQEVAERIVNLQLDRDLQARIDELAVKANRGQLSNDERTEYEAYVEGMDLVGIFKAKARKALRQQSR
jgi:hypothetical protein